MAALVHSRGVLPPAARQSRFGLAYLRAVASRAGLRFEEGPPEEDYVGIDVTIMGSTIVWNNQVKTEGSIDIGCGAASASIDVKTLDKINLQPNPTFLIVVLVDKAEASRLAHMSDHVQLNACAYWGRLDGLSVPTTTQSTLTVHAKHRLDDSGLTSLMDEVESAYTGRVV